MKRALLLLALLFAAACGSSQPPSAPTTSASAVPPAHDPPPAPSTSKAVAKEESVEDAAKAFFETIVAGDRKAALARTVSFDEMNAMTKKVTDRQAYEAEINDQVERLCQELAGKNIKVKEARVVRRRTAKVSENPEKVKVDVELAAMALVFEMDGQTREAPTFSFIKTNAGWKYTTRNS